LCIEDLGLLEEVVLGEGHGICEMVGEEVVEFRNKGIIRFISGTNGRDIFEDIESFLVVHQADQTRGIN